MSVLETHAANQTWKQNREVMPTVTAGQSDESNQDAFYVLDGYHVEKLFDVPRDELGSWVSLTTDPQGRLYACDQQEKGLVRITPATLDGSTQTVVEKVPAELSGAQGLLWAFDSLYAVCNGGGFHGLFRLTDSDGDSLPDQVEKLHGIAAGGEHGAHNILLAPDGKRLFIICGNHTKLPFAVTDVTEPQTMAGIRPNQRRVSVAADGSSRLPANWDEDQIITRMWDGNGHATGRLAPGGYIVSTDPEGKTWELWSAGYRNPYDFGFNADGEIFAYDADMEWDFGMPWYRPTRVNHATSGSELGWRSGTAKWPAAYPDSLPAMVDIGPGSPVGAAFGYGAKIPAKYQKAFYICDWTFGTMYAIHLTPSGSTYTAEKEEFVARNALPLTDMTISKDGAIYFAVGGRGGQSELYRVTYTGNEATDPVDATDAAGAAERKIRRQLEAFHAPQKNPASAIDLALRYLGSTDRFIRYAARIVLEHQPVDTWQTKALASSEPRACINGAIAVARQAEQASQPDVLAALDKVAIKDLDKDTLLDLIRAYELAFIRLGEPTDGIKQQVAEKFAPLFPAGQQATLSQGSVTPVVDHTVQVSGLDLLTITQGVNSIQIDGNVTVFVGEDAMQSSIGSLSSVTGTAVVSPNGQALSGSIGQVVPEPKIPVDVTGISMSASLGSITLIQTTNESVSGQAATISQGTVIPIAVYPVTTAGLLTGSIGQVSVSGAANISVSGIGLTANIGSVNVTAWSEIDPGVNNVWTEVDRAA